MLPVGYRNMLRSICLIFLLGFGGQLAAQQSKVENLPEFHERWIHFGFILSGNNSDFTVFRDSPFGNSITQDTIFGIKNEPQKGFGLQGLMELHMHEYFRLRLLPGFRFADRKMIFTVRQGKDTLQYKKLIESFYVDVPLMLKYRSKRLNNFAAYVAGGGRYTYDLLSNHKVDNLSSNPKDILVILKPHDWSAEVAFGTDFYLQYFKFGIELKMSYGLQNILLKDGTMFSNAISDLRSKMFTISFTFEG